MPEVEVDQNEVKRVQEEIDEEFAKFQENEIKADKQWRVELDEILQKIKIVPGSRERALCVIKLQEAIMWLGMDLKERGAPNPYPNSYNPQNAIVEPTADGMKM